MLLAYKIVVQKLLVHWSGRPVVFDAALERGAADVSGALRIDQEDARADRRDLLKIHRARAFQREQSPVRQGDQVAQADLPAPVVHAAGLVDELPRRADRLAGDLELL